MRNKMILYDYKRAPNARRVRIFLAEKKINIEIKNVDLMKQENIQDDFLKINPSGTVPFLQIKERVKGLPAAVHGMTRPSLVNSAMNRASVCFHQRNRALFSRSAVLRSFWGWRENGSLWEQNTRNSQSTV